MHTWSAWLLIVRLCFSREPERRTHVARDDVGHIRNLDLAAFAAQQMLFGRKRRGVTPDSRDVLFSGFSALGIVTRPRHSAGQFPSSDQNRSQ